MGEWEKRGKLLFLRQDYFPPDEGCLLSGCPLFPVLFQDPAADLVGRRRGARASAFFVPTSLRGIRGPHEAWSPIARGHAVPGILSAWVAHRLKGGAGSPRPEPSLRAEQCEARVWGQRPLRRLESGIHGGVIQGAPRRVEGKVGWCAVPILQSREESRKCSLRVPPGDPLRAPGPLPPARCLLLPGVAGISFPKNQGPSYQPAFPEGSTYLKP